MIKNIYEPDNEDIKDWLSVQDRSWPASDWDYYIMNGKNDDWVFRFANDKSCEEQPFFLHCLYYFIGDCFNGNLVQKYSGRINHLLEKVDNDSLLEVKKWKEKTIDLLSGKLDYDSEFWLNYLFYESIQELKSNEKNDVKTDDNG